MTIKRNRFLLTASLALIGFSMKMALADEWNKEMVLRFSAPVQVPGHVLQPGKYVFRLADSPSDRNIVQIFSVNGEGREKFLATIFTVSDFLTKTPEKPTVQFEERRGDAPEAIKSWFYPGDNTGWHFVYPKSERLEVASVAEPPAAPATPPAEPPAAAEPSAPVEPPQEASVVVIEETVISQVEPPSAPSGDDQPLAELTLPETAGYSAAFLVGGLVTIGAGLLVLFFSLRNRPISVER